MRVNSVPAHVGRRLELRIGARTGRAEQIAAVGGLQIEADRQPLRLLAAPAHRRSRNSAAGRPSARRRSSVMTRAFRRLARQPEPGAEIGGRQQSSIKAAVLGARNGVSAGSSEPPSNNSACSCRSACESSTSYQAGRRCTSRPISRARSSVWPRDALGAPVDVVEQPPVRLLDAEQVIAAVGRGTEHGAVARPRQHLGGLDQQRRRQGRAVGIEHDGGRMAGGEQAADRLEQTIAEIRAATIRSGRSRAADCRQRTVASPAAHRPCSREWRRGAPAARRFADTSFRKAVLKAAASVGGERRRQAGLGAARNGGLRHHGNAAGAAGPRRPASCSNRSVPAMG